MNPDPSKSVGYLIQQPELHLHPRAQAAFGEFLYKGAADGHFFVVETHSDYLIDRFRLMQKEDQTPFDAQILYFESKKHGNTLSPINLDNGDVISPPDGYRSFFLNEEMQYFEKL